jgi:hypothetical protein
MREFFKRYGGLIALLGIVAIFVAAVAGAGQLQNTNSINQFDKDLHGALVKVCQDRINPILNVQREQLQRDIRQNKSFDFSKFFPKVPPAQLHALIQSQIQQDKQLLKTIPSVNCSKIFPVPK